MTVSVYIPTRNRVESLGRSIRSVLCQTHHDIELIVVDDGSDDATPEYLREVAAADARVRVLRNERSEGAPQSRNRAILAAEGEFVTGLDDDDEFLPRRIEQFVAAWSLFNDWQVPVSCLYAQDIHVSHGEQTYVSAKCGSATYISMCAANQVGNQIFAPKHHFISAGLFDTSLEAWQDLEFFMRLIRLHGCARLVDVPNYLFDTTPRADRISASYDKVRRASLKIAKGILDDRQAQLLMLQAFTSNYGMKPRISDWRAFLGRGWWSRGMMQMLRSYTR